MMTESDKSLIKQLIHAGRQGVIHDLMPEYNFEKSQEIIREMGAKWCCHPDNAVKRLDVPLPLLNEPRTKVLKGRK